MNLALRVQVLIDAGVIAALDRLKDTKHDVRVLTASHIDMLAYASRASKGHFHRISWTNCADTFAELAYGEFYDIFDEVLEDVDDNTAREQLRRHVDHRATVAGVSRLLESAGFAVNRVVERAGRMRFSSGPALLNHHFIKLGFLDGWKQVVHGREPEVFERLHRRLNEIARRQGELSLTIPMLYVEGVARET